MKEGDFSDAERVNSTARRGVVNDLDARRSIDTVCAQQLHERVSTLSISSETSAINAAECFKCEEANLCSQSSAQKQNYIDDIF